MSDLGGEKPSTIDVKVRGKSAVDSVVLGMVLYLLARDENTKKAIDDVFNALQDLVPRIRDNAKHPSQEEFLKAFIEEIEVLDKLRRGPPTRQDAREPPPEPEAAAY